MMNLLSALLLNSTITVAVPVCHYGSVCASTPLALQCETAPQRDPIRY
jgi:hypothetical protein